jgi:hypothetical protein
MIRNLAKPNDGNCAIDEPNHCSELEKPFTFGNVADNRYCVELKLVVSEVERLIRLLRQPQPSNVATLRGDLLEARDRRKSPAHHIFTWLEWN